MLYPARLATTPCPPRSNASFRLRRPFRGTKTQATSASPMLSWEDANRGVLLPSLASCISLLTCEWPLFALLPTTVRVEKGGRVYCCTNYILNSINRYPILKPGPFVHNRGFHRQEEGTTCSACPIAFLGKIAAQRDELRP